MRIGFDISQTGANKAGCGYVAYALMNELLRSFPDHHYVLYPSFGDYFYDPALAQRSPWTGENITYGPRHASLTAAASFWTSGDLQSQLEDIDVLHANNFWCPKVSRTPVVYTLYDLSFLEHPWYTTEANRLGCFDGIFRAAQHADWIMSISESSRAHFLRVFPHFPAERVVVIYPCSRFSTPLGEGTRPAALRGIGTRQFWLNVGTIEPRKNQERLAQAFAVYLSRGGRPRPLVFAGGKGWMMDTFRQTVADVGIKDQVMFTGYVDDQELTWLYRNCYANVYPSLFEGFGLPVLEGMQAGAPTIASTSTSIPEVTADAAVLVDPNNTDELAEAMLRFDLDEDLRDRMADKAVVRAAAFQWSDSIAKLESLYRTAAAAPKRNASREPVAEAAA